MLSKEKQNLLSRNLDALKTRDPQQAEDIRQASVPVGVGVSEAEGGLLTMEFPGPAGNRISLYARDRMREQIEEELGGVDFRAEDATFLMGFGLGYHVEWIARHMEIDHQVFVWEPVEGLFRLALETRDVRHLLEHDRVHLFVGPRPSSLHDTLTYHAMRFVAGEMNQWTLRPLKEAFPRPYREAEDALEKARLHIRFSYGHLTRNGNLLVENILRNQWLLPHSASVHSLRGVLEGKPAIVVSGGPSLSKNMDHLREAKGRLCLISVDTALKPLLEKGIEPDIVVSSDPLKINVRKIDGLTGHEEIPLVYDLGVNPKIPALFSGLKFVSGSEIALVKWLLGLVGFEETYAQALSSAHFAFFLARDMGAAPIIFAGLDLAFSGEAHHVEGAAETWRPGKQAPYLDVPGVFGGTVKTIPGFLSMIGLFEREIAETPARCFDATEGGARIRGTIVATLSEMIQRFQGGPELRMRERLEQAHRMPSPLQRESHKQGLFRLAEEAEAVRRIAEKGLHIVSKGRTLLKQDRLDVGEFQKTADQILQLDHELAEKKLFEEVMLDFRGELLTFQFLQSYRIQREGDQRANLDLTLESMEHSFQDAAALSTHILPRIQEPPEKAQG